MEAAPGSSLAATFNESQITALESLPLPTVPPEGITPLLQAGRSGLTKIRQAGDSPPELTETEIVGLEAIILLEGRPSILIENGHFATPPYEWSILESYRQSIERVIPSVGRIEVQGHPRMEWMGTGFLVAPDVIMTNRHVAVLFSEKRSGEGWQFKSGMTPRIDFREEYRTSTSAEYNCVEVIGVHTQVDMALLRVELASSNGGGLPEPLTIHYRTPRGLRDRNIYVVGYPAWDGRRNDPDAMRDIFNGIYNVKRLQPGTIRNHFVFGRTLKHNSSTLGGNSGSCVVDLETNKVLGLHFGGLYQRYNSAVALWRMRRSTFLLRAGVNFG